MKTVGMSVIYLALSGAILGAVPEFEHHYIAQDPTWDHRVMRSVLVDIDKDGDLDWTAGNCRWTQNPNFYWYEYKTPGKWVEHLIDEGTWLQGSGTCALDVNGDGQPDLVTSKFLFVNRSKDSQWEKHEIGISDGRSHDFQAVDINGDRRIDILSNSQDEGLCWYEAGKNPNKPWTRHDIGGKRYKVHGCGSPEGAADLDGDGDIDVAAALAWFENADGKALQWKKHDHNLIGRKDKFGIAVMTVCRDIDADGDIDIVQSEGDHPDARLGWLENTDGKGKFSIHWIKNSGSGQDFHTLQVIDYDNDGDLDVFTGGGAISKAEVKHTYLFEHIKPVAGKLPKWKEHIILSGPECHGGIAGDVDADGDIDIIVRGYNRGPFIYLENKHEDNI